MKLEIVLASNNKNKLREVREILTPHGITVYSLKDVGIEADADENGLTYAENALIKAKEVAKYTTLPVISDDSGIEIKALDNAPGIHSARFAQSFGDYPKTFDYIFKALEGETREARFVCDIVMVNYEKEPLVFEGVVPGSIALKPFGEGGFGYDPIFVCNETGKTYSEMTEEDKNKASHRGKALHLLLDYLKTK